MMNPVMALLALMITLGQEKQLSHITKNFVTLGFILNIDNMYAVSLPKEIKENAQRINEAGGLRMGSDNNNMSSIYKRILQGGPILDEILNILINISYTVMTNFQIILINYFAPMMVVVIQVIGFYGTSFMVHIWRDITFNA